MIFSASSCVKTLKVLEWDENPFYGGTTPSVRGVEGTMMFLGGKQRMVLDCQRLTMHCSHLISLVTMCRQAVSKRTEQWSGSFPSKGCRGSKSERFCSPRRFAPETRAFDPQSASEQSITKHKVATAVGLELPD